MKKIILIICTILISSSSFAIFDKNSHQSKYERVVGYFLEDARLPLESEISGLWAGIALFENSRNRSYGLFLGCKGYSTLDRDGTLLGGNYFGCVSYSNLAEPDFWNDSLKRREQMNGIVDETLQVQNYTLEMDSRVNALCWNNTIGPYNPGKICLKIYNQNSVNYLLYIRLSSTSIEEAGYFKEKVWKY